jgi:EAL domain-containing protein (putative c-di-GMP-specific phosphodiesterase class I)
MNAARVLLVDDEPAITRSLGRCLRADGYEVVTCNDAAQAAALVAASRFDVIVSDICMPEVNGLSLLRAIRAGDPDVPVLFLTGSPTLDTAVEALEQGAYRYLVKPIMPDELSEVVGRAAAWHRLARVQREAAQAVHDRADQRRAALEARFEAACARLWIAMQPIVSWRTRTLFAYEALVRTDESSLGNPTALFDAAERLDRTRELGRAIRRRVADALDSHPEAPQIFVNLNACDLDDPDLLSADGALAPFAPRVVLEVTERAALDSVPRLAERIARLRELGYRIALDDLGAGHAGLAGVAQLEPDVVKVDMALIRHIDASAVKQKLFRSIATLCDDLGIRLVAEGIERTEERDVASSLGGDLFQGFLFAQPQRGMPTPRY